MSLFIETLEGVRYDLAQYGLKPIKFEIDSPSPRTEREVIDGRDGHVDLETTFEGRSIRASFLIQANDFADYHLVRHEIFKLFNAKNLFYIIDSRLSKQRWKVRTSARFSIERINFVNGLFNLEFLSPSPYAESTGSTLDPLSFESETWGVGEGLEAEDISYIHNTTSFSIFNAGDITLDPRELPLKITFSGVSDNLTISNTTTGDLWAYTGQTQADDAILLDGIKVTKNGLSDFKNTNKKVITLVPGWNDFTISGATDFTIQFEFRFYYI